MFDKFEKETEANLQQPHSDSRHPHQGTTMFGSCKSHAISNQEISWCQNGLADWFKMIQMGSGHRWMYRWHVPRTTEACSYECSWNLASLHLEPRHVNHIEMSILKPLVVDFTMRSHQDSKSGLCGVQAAVPKWILLQDGWQNHWFLRSLCTGLTSCIFRWSKEGQHLEFCWETCWSSIVPHILWWIDVNSLPPWNAVLSAR